jgi:hypothetical protein
LVLEEGVGEYDEFAHDGGDGDFWNLMSDWYLALRSTLKRIAARAGMERARPQAASLWCRAREGAMIGAGGLEDHAGHITAKIQLSPGPSNGQHELRPYRSNESI